TGIPCEQAVRYFYFRTTLHVPGGIDPTSVHLLLDRVDDGLAVFVNGTKTWQATSSLFGAPRVTIPLPPGLHQGSNRIVLLLADWCVLAELHGAWFVGGRAGEQRSAVLPEEPPETERILPTPVTVPIPEPPSTLSPPIPQPTVALKDQPTLTLSGAGRRAPAPK